MANTRRQFLKHTLSAAAACGIGRLGTADESAPLPILVDTHVYLGHWPHKSLTSEHPEKLADQLRGAGIGRAWAGSFDGVFHKNIAGVNERLADACAELGDSLFIPFGTVNPNLPDWEDDVRRCHEVHRMSGVRLHPNYHGYSLDDPHFARLVQLAGERELIVQIVTWMDQQKHLMLNPHNERVNLGPLPKVAAQHPKTRFVLANSFQQADDAELLPLLSHTSVWFDFARVQAPNVLRQLLSRISSEHVVFGSGAPLHDIGSAAKTMWQSQIAQTDLQAIAADNASSLIERH